MFRTRFQINKIKVLSEVECDSLQKTRLNRSYLLTSQHAQFSGRMNELKRDSHSKFASEHCDFGAGLLLPETPLHQVLSRVIRKRDVPASHRRRRRSAQDVRLSLEMGAQSVGI